MDGSRSPIRQVQLGFLMNQIIVLPTDDPEKNYKALQFWGVK